MRAFIVIFLSLLCIPAYAAEDILLPDTFKKPSMIIPITTTASKFATPLTLTAFAYTQNISYSYVTMAIIMAPIVFTPWMSDKLAEVYLKRSMAFALINLAILSYVLG